MAVEVPGLSETPDLTKSFTGTVVETADPDGEGRVGVHVAELFPESDPRPGGAQPTKTPLPGNIFENQADLGLPAFVAENNYIWARPSWMILGENLGGYYRVPVKGTQVEVFFRDGDIKKAYWRGQTLTAKGAVTPGKNLAKAKGFERTADHWKDIKAKPRVEVLYEDVNGTICYIDNNEETNGFVLELNNGHRLAVFSGGEASGAYLKTADGHIVDLNDTTKQITIKTQTSQCQAVMDDRDGTIKFRSVGKMTLEADDEILVKAKGAMTIQSDASILIKAPTVDVNP